MIPLMASEMSFHTEKKKTKTKTKNEKPSKKTKQHCLK